MVTILSLLLQAFVFFYTSYLVGMVLLRFLRLYIKTETRRFLYALLLGLGTWGCAGFVFALFGVFSGTSLRIFLLAIILAGIPELTRHIRWLLSPHQIATSIRSLKQKLLSGYVFQKLIIVVWIAINISIVFVPLTGHDTLDYHLPIMSSLITTGGFSEIASMPSYPHIPIFGEIVYAVPMALFNASHDPLHSQVFQILQFASLLLLLLLFYDFFRHRLNYPFLGITMLFFILAYFDLQREIMHGGYVDIPGYLFGSTGLLIIIENVERKILSGRELLLSAIFFGFALAIKYFAGFFVLAGGLFLLYWLIRNRHEYKRFLVHVSLMLCTMFLIAGFWYGKNYAEFGNPIYPLFSDAESTVAVGGFLIERTLLNFFTFPFHRYASVFWSVTDSSSRLVVFAYYCLLLGLSVFVLLKRRKLKPIETMLLVFVVLYYTTMFLFSHQHRFQIPVVLFMIPIIILFLDFLYTWLRGAFSERNFNRFMKVSFWGLNLLFLFIFLGNIHYFQVKFKYRLGILTTERYIHDIGGQ